MLSSRVKLGVEDELTAGILAIHRVLHLIDVHVYALLKRLVHDGQVGQQLVLDLRQVCVADNFA